MARIDGGEVLVRALVMEGVEVIFSISDIDSSPMLRSAEAAGIRHVGPRHESAGVHMADAWARTTGRMAVVVGAAGPGVANMVPGLMCAWMEGVPVLAIGTQRVRRSTHAVRRGRFQFGPQVEVVRPVTKFAATVEEARRIPEFVREAYRRALSGRQGPAFLEIPADVLLETVDEDEVPCSSRTATGSPRVPPTPPPWPRRPSCWRAGSPGARRPRRPPGRRRRRAASGGRAPRRARHDHTRGTRRLPRGPPPVVGMTFPSGTPAHLDS